MKFKKGDRIMIRYWDDMAEEYKLDGDGDIIFGSAPCCFSKEMRPLCGAQATVKDLEGDMLCLKDWNTPIDINTKFGFIPQMCVLVERPTKTEKLTDFSKNNLRANDWCVFRDGRVSRVVNTQEGVLLIGTGWSGIAEFNDDLTHKAYAFLDIVTVRRPELAYQYIEAEYENAPIVFQRYKS